VVVAGDPRVLFAAERTLLAWLRSSISLTALGFAVAKFGLIAETLRGTPPTPAQHFATLAIGVGLVIAGVLMNLLAAWQYRTALRNVPATDFPPGYRAHAVELVAAGVSILGILLGVYLVAF
jgi:putative membrane protein